MASDSKLIALEIHRLQAPKANRRATGVITAQIEAKGFEVYKYIDLRQPAAQIEDAAAPVGERLILSPA